MAWLWPGTARCIADISSATAIAAEREADANAREALLELERRLVTLTASTSSASKDLADVRVKLAVQQAERDSDRAAIHARQSEHGDELAKLEDLTGLRIAGAKESNSFAFTWTLLDEAEPKRAFSATLVISDTKQNGKNLYLRECAVRLCSCERHLISPATSQVGRAAATRRPRGAVHSRAESQPRSVRLGTQDARRIRRVARGGEGSQGCRRSVATRDTMWGEFRRSMY